MSSVLLSVKSNVVIISILNALKFGQGIGFKKNRKLIVPCAGQLFLIQFFKNWNNKKKHMLWNRVIKSKFSSIVQDADWKTFQTTHINAFFALHLNSVRSATHQENTSSILSSEEMLMVVGEELRREEKTNSRLKTTLIVKGKKLTLTKS